MLLILTTPSSLGGLWTGRTRGNAVDCGEGGVGSVRLDGRSGVPAACRERHQFS